MLNAVCDVFKEAYSRNWITTRDGNASVRRPNDPFFYVTPSGVRKNKLEPEMMIKLDIDKEGTSREKWLNQNEGLLKQQLNRGLSPTGELPLHWLLQRNLGNTEHPRVVMHLHPTHIIAAMHAGVNLKYIASIFPELSRYTSVGNTVEYIPPITEQLGVATSAAFFDKSDLWNIGLETAKHVFVNYQPTCNIVGLKNHGVVSIGIDPWDAFEHIERLNHICEIFLLANKNEFKENT